ncbi:MAG TPA: hypothetical protein VFC41_07030 [Anaerovoracaceae bacterium]|nr:hypothetical protein [Anaerovoracaceae bacterium]
MNRSTNIEKSKLLKTLSQIGEESGFEKAVEAATEASRLETFDSDSLKAIYAYQNMIGLNIAEVMVPEGLPNMKQIIPVIDAFDTFLKKGGAMQSC